MSSNFSAWCITDLSEIAFACDRGGVACLLSASSSDSDSSLGELLRAESLSGGMSMIGATLRLHKHGCQGYIISHQNYD